VARGADEPGARKGTTAADGGSGDFVGASPQGERQDAEVIELAARRQITVLVVGTEDWANEQAAASLEASGHVVLRCHEPGEQPFPCNALIPGRTCPLLVGFDVVLAVRTRPAPVPSPGEIGVVCALGRNIPLVVAGLLGDKHFGEQATVVVGRNEDLVAACEVAAAMGGSHYVAKVIPLPANGGSRA
jgi:hypothetical protein